MLNIDLRSDTVTRPTEEMKREMYEAELGDDVYGEDPTTNAFQEEVAEMLGKEASVLVSSGTQGNLISLLSWADRGDEVLVGDQSHIFLAEAGGASVLGSLVLYPLLTNEDGYFSEQSIVDGIKPRDYHKPTTKLLCIENTHNLSSGRVLDVSRIKFISNLSKSNNLKLHMDGARLFNATTFLKVNPSELVKDVDSVTFCLSKGLSCPIGSVVSGDKEFISEAKKWRKMLGSGMRQVGVIAAAGRVALRTMIDRLEEDHINAKKLANGLANLNELKINPHRIQTNIVRFYILSGKGEIIANYLEEEGIKVNPGKFDLRMVTHREISAEDIDITLLIMEKVLKKIFN